VTAMAAAIWNSDLVRGDIAVPRLRAIFRQLFRFGNPQARPVLCDPFPGETACACSLGESTHYSARGRDPSFIEGWIAFPIAIADGTATGTVFLETAPPSGVRSRVVANLSVNRGGVQNWIHFRLPFGDELEIEGAYGVRATLVATDALTGEKRLFGTTRAAALQRHRPEAGGIILELEDWG
jgi:hypothetical protein